MNDLALDVILTLLAGSSRLLKWKLFASPSTPSSILFAPRRCDRFWNSQWHLTAKHSTAGFSRLPPFLTFVFFFFSFFVVQSRHTHTLALSLMVQQRADGLMPGCRYSALFKSISRTALSHLPPRFSPHPTVLISASLTRTCLSSGTRFSRCQSQQHFDLSFCFLSFKKMDFGHLKNEWAITSQKTAPPLPKAIVYRKSIDFKIVLDDMTYVIIRILSLMIYSLPSWVVKQINSSAGIRCPIRRPLMFCMWMCYAHVTRCLPPHHLCSPYVWSTARQFFSRAKVSSSSFLVPCKQQCELTPPPRSAVFTVLNNNRKERGN